MSVVVVTAIYDGYDRLFELPAQDIDVDAVCVTDDPDLTSESWRIVYDPRPGVNPYRASKRPKMTPWIYSDANASVWIDSSIHVYTHTFVREVLERADPWVQFCHRERDCVYDEATFSLTMPKYRHEPLAAQVARYREEGHPAHWGLWSCGVLGRIHTPRVMGASSAWLAEVEAWSFQDQVSHPVMMRRFGLRPSLLPGFYWPGENPWLGWEGSTKH